MADSTTSYSINPDYLCDSFKTHIKQGLEGHSKPFPHFFLPKFTTTPSTKPLREELAHLDWRLKSNDLYTLKQSDDLQNVIASDSGSTKFPSLAAFIQFLHEDVKPWLQQATGVELNEKIAVTASKYERGDNLLPHDDRLEGRAFAFVYYLADSDGNGWGDELGGRLLLYNSDAQTNSPTTIEKRLVPSDNAFVFFRVQHNSWHSVEEVLAGASRSRLSLNGWFHADSCDWVKEPSTPNPAPPLAKIKPESGEITIADLRSHLNHQYLTPESILRINQVFAKKSELCLANFLNADFYKSVLKELQSAEFNAMGPPNKRSFLQLNTASLPSGSHLSTLLRLFRSDILAQLLTRWTGLKLSKELAKPNGHAIPPPEKRPRLEDQDPQPQPSTSSSTPFNGGNGPAAVAEVELISTLANFQHGSYSLADDQMAADVESNGFCLDVALYLMPDEKGDNGGGAKWEGGECGGFTSYFARDEEDEILRASPKANTAYIVFREPEVLHFTKYVNCKVGDGHFFLLANSYFGVMDENEDEEEEEESGGDDEELDEEEGDDAYGSEIDENDEEPEEGGASSTGHEI